MKTFDEEYIELLDWYEPKSRAIDEIPWDGVSLDGNGTKEKRELTHEYRKKLKALKKKYNIA